MSRKVLVFASCAPLLLLGCAASHDTTTVSVAIAGATDVVSGQDTGGGHVVSTPPGIDCTRLPGGPKTGICTMTISDKYTSQEIVLTAQPDAASNSDFLSWANTANGSDLEGPLEVRDPSLILLTKPGRSYSLTAAFVPGVKK